MKCILVCDTLPLLFTVDGNDFRTAKRQVTCILFFGAIVELGQHQQGNLTSKKISNEIKWM